MALVRRRPLAFFYKSFHLITFDVELKRCFSHQFNVLKCKTGFNDRLDEDEDTLIIESDSEESNGTEPEVTSKPTVSFSSSTSTSVFRPVTFPPRTSSTAKTSAPVSSTVSTPLASSTAGNRFTLRKTLTTERPAITFRSKFNKPAVNNLVGASALPTGTVPSLYLINLVMQAPSKSIRPQRDEGPIGLFFREEQVFHYKSHACRL